MSLFRRKPDNAKALEEDANRLMGDQADNLMTDPEKQNLKEGDMRSFVPQSSQSQDNVQRVQKFVSDYLNLVIFGRFQNNFRHKNRNFQNCLSSSPRALPTRGYPHVGWALPTRFRLKVPLPTWQF